jgi:hypothetical protein
MVPSMPQPKAQPQLQPALSPYGGGDAAMKAADAMRRRMGMAATILTPPGGPAAGATTGMKTLLGAGA